MPVKQRPPCGSKFTRKRRKMKAISKWRSLFRVISFSEEIHGARALRVLKEIKGTEENLAASFESEKKVAEVAYDQFVKLAEEEGNKEAVSAFQPEQGCGRDSCQTL